MNDFNRRQIVDMTVGAFLGLIVELPKLALAAQRANGLHGFLRQSEAINWSAFLDMVAKAATTQYLPNWDQEGYVKKIGDLAGRLESKDLPGTYRNTSACARVQRSRQEGELSNHPDLV